MSQSPSSTPSPPPPAKRRRRVGCQMVLLIGVALLLLTGGLMYGLWKSEPAYWTRNQTFLQSHDNETLLQMAHAAFSKVIGQATDLDPSGNPGQVRRVRLTLDETNAWMYTQLPGWLLHDNIELPPEIGTLMLATEGDRLVLAMEYRSPQFTQIFSGLFRVSFQPDGKAKLHFDRARGGRMPIPIASETLGRRIGAAAGEEAQKKIDAVIKTINNQTFDPIQKIDGTRQVRIVGYQLMPDAIELSLRTEPREKK